MICKRFNEIMTNLAPVFVVIGVLGIALLFAMPYFESQRKIAEYRAWQKQWIADVGRIPEVADEWRRQLEEKEASNDTLESQAEAPGG